jgi:hypothetical protein
LGAAASGAGAGFVISGGELTTAVSGGAAAAPSGAAITGAFLADATAVLALSTQLGAGDRQVVLSRTKQGLGKVVPAAGIVIGGALNWATVEGIVDAADIAYRRRFLLEKYPRLSDGDTFGTVLDVDQVVPDEDDEAISVLDELAEAGGPNIE